MNGAAQLNGRSNRLGVVILILMILQLGLSSWLGVALWTGKYPAQSRRPQEAEDSKGGYPCHVPWVDWSGAARASPLPSELR